MKIAIDIDGTIYDTERNFRVQAELYDMEVVHGKGMKDSLAIWAEDRYDWSDEQNEDFLSRFATITRESNLIPGAKEIIEKLQDEGVKMVIVTARGQKSNKYSKELIDSAMDKFKDDKLTFDEYYFGHLDKTEICKKENIDYLIDDSPDVCKSTSEAGIKTIFLHDSGIRGVEQNENLFEVHNWGEIYRILHNELTK